MQRDYIVASTKGSKGVRACLQVVVQSEAVKESDGWPIATLFRIWLESKNNLEVPPQVVCVSRISSMSPRALAGHFPEGNVPVSPVCWG